MTVVIAIAFSRCGMAKRVWLILHPPFRDIYIGIMHPHMLGHAELSLQDVRMLTEVPQNNHNNLQYCP